MKQTYIFVLLGFSGLLTGQYSEQIVSGRPGQSIPAATVGRGVYQVQTGLNLDWTLRDGGNLLDLTETTDLRIGLLKWLELSAIVAGAADEFVVPPAGRRRDRGISDTQLGLLFLLLENDGWRPALALRGHALLRVQDEDFRRAGTGSNFILAAAWNLTDALALTANLARTYPGDGSRSDDWVTTLDISLSDRWGAFAESYGTLTGVATANYDGGFSYLAADDLAFDLSAGWDGDYGERSWFLDFGVSFRVVARTRAAAAADRAR